MEISNRLLANKPPITIYPGALMERPALLPGIAVCIANWADIEARLDTLFLLTAKNEEALASFMAAKGWGRKEKQFYEWLRDGGDQEFATAVRSILRTVAEPARKRHCLAHGVWGLSERYPDDLVIVPESFYLDTAREALRAETLGSVEFRLDSERLFANARLVGWQELQSLDMELSAARDLIHRFMIEQTPELVKVKGRDELAKAANDPR
ncbi:MAG: hypothetical protein H2048_02765, partial [Erythrobacter sp.]|nr:hypothetical protein [Erythrobacter sp.]